MLQRRFLEVWVCLVNVLNFMVQGETNNKCVCIVEQCNKDYIIKNITQTPTNNSNILQMKPRENKEPITKPKFYLFFL